MKRFFVAFLCVILVFSFVGCGGQTEESEAPIEEEVEEIPFVDVNWQTLEHTVETDDGYSVNIKVKFSPFVSSNDVDALKSLWGQVGGEGDCPTTAEIGMDSQDIPYNDGFGTETMKYSHDEVLYAFGTLQAENVTEGFSITEENKQSVPTRMGTYAPTSIGVFQTHLSSNSPAVFLCKMIFYFSNGVDEFFGTGPTLSMSSDYWGPVPFIIAMPNQHTPNNPDGDPATDQIMVALAHDGPFKEYEQAPINKYAGSDSATQQSGSNNSEYEVGKQYTVLTSLKVRTGPGTYYDQKNRSDLKSEDYANSEDGALAALKKGSKVTCIEAAGSWMKISSGWICCKDGDEVLVR